MIRVFGLLALLVALTGCSSTKTTDSSASAGAMGSSLQVDDLRFTIPDQWQAEEPTSTSRKAQYALTDAGSDDPGSCVIYFFGGGGAGNIQANLDRWIGQFANAAGEPPADTAVHETRTIAGLPVHTLDVSGRYIAEVTPGSDERHDKPNQRLIAAIVEAPAGAYYLKVLGPVRIIDAQEAAILAMIDSMRHEPTGREAVGAGHP